MSDVWRIFVVASDESLNQSLVNALRKDGYAVQGVTSGADAVRILWAEEHDVVICDLRTPGADGFELLQWLRVYRPNTRMIMLGDANGGDIRMQALESGADSYLERPLDIRLLKEELRRLLQQTGFSASLDSFDLLDVIQIITMSRKSMTLLINTGLEERGTLCFQTGELTWAEYGILRGEEAFFALAAHKNGTVIQQPWNDQTASNVTQPLSRLIFQALQYRSKYADRQQYSGEIARVSSPSSFAPMQEPQGSAAPSFSSEQEIDDRPFVFVDDAQGASSMQSMDTYQPSVPMPTSPAATQPAPMSPIPPTLPYAMPPYQQQPALEPESPPAKEWWESTAHLARVQVPNAPSQVEEDESLAPTMALDSHALNALLSQISEPAPQQNPSVPPTQGGSLPSWLTDQPTSGFPALRPSSPAGSSSADHPSMPRIPATPGSTNWILPQEYSAPTIHTDQLPLEATHASVPQEASPTDIWNQPTPLAHSGPLRSSQPDWSPDAQSTDMHIPSQPLMQPAPELQYYQAAPAQPMQSSQPMPAVQPQPYQVRTMSQPLYDYAAPTAQPTSDQTTLVPPLPEDDEDGDASQLSSGVLRAQSTARRNYASLVAALQSLGYSVTGFIAAAVVTLAGQTIAQVAINEMDVSKICKYCSSIQKNVLQAFDDEEWGEYEDTVITSGDRHILMRVVGSERRAFQVLITTREANPQDCLEIMANVDSAISAALR